MLKFVGSQKKASCFAINHFWDLLGIIIIVPARIYPGTKATFSQDSWFVDILQVEAVNDSAFLLFFDVSCQMMVKNAMMVRCRFGG